MHNLPQCFASVQVHCDIPLLKIPAFIVVHQDGFSWSGASYSFPCAGKHGSNTRLQNGRHCLGVRQGMFRHSFHAPTSSRPAQIEDVRHHGQGGAGRRSKPDVHPSQGLHRHRQCRLRVLPSLRLRGQRGRGRKVLHHRGNGESENL